MGKKMSPCFHRNCFEVEWLAKFCRRDSCSYKNIDSAWMKLTIEVSFHKHHLIMSFPNIIYSGMFNVRRGIYHFDKIYYPSSVVENHLQLLKTS